MPIDQKAMERRRKQLERVVFFAYGLAAVGFVVAVAFLLSSLLSNADKAEAADLTISWSHTFYNSDTLNCKEADTLSVATDMRGVQLWRVRFGATNDTTYLGEFLALSDSVSFPHPDSGFYYGEILAKGADQSNNTSCVVAHSVFVKPKIESPPQPANPGLDGSYYDGLNYGTFCTNRTDQTIDFDWGYAGPFACTGVDSFSVRWVGKLTIPTTGTWTLYQSTEDGCRLTVDGVMRISNWVWQSEREVSWSGALSAGQRDILFEYFHKGGHAAAHFRWAGPGVAKQAVPSWALSR